MAAYVYILRCRDDTLYTGWTVNLTKRIAAHNNGRASKYTRVRLPVTMIYWEEHEEKVSAMKREAQIKKLTRTAKLLLAAAKF